jgi:hypothetical protein
MSQDVLGFAKLMSGINLTEYVINYIDQHMLLYGFLGQLNNQILVSTENETTVKYTLTELSDIEKGIVNTFKSYIKENPVLKIYNINYYINIPDDSIQDDNSFIIRIQQCC